MPSAFVLVYFAVFFCTCLAQTQSVENGEQELMEAFVTSCEEVVPVSEGISCNDAYVSFLSAFQGTPSLVPPPANQFNYEGYYHTYFTTMKFLGPIRDLVLFWSKTQELQKKLVSAGANIKSSDSIFASKVIDQMSAIANITKWCSSATGTISVKEECDMYGISKMNTAAYVFWAEFSERLAEYAEGSTFFLTVNATYKETSFFGSFELPIILLPQSSSSKLVVINVVPTGSSNLCGTGSLMTLQSKVDGVIEYKCFDVYGDAEKPSSELINCVNETITGVQEGKDDDSIVCASSAISTSDYTMALLMSCILVAAGFFLN